MFAYLLACSIEKRDGTILKIYIVHHSLQSTFNVSIKNKIMQYILK